MSADVVIRGGTVIDGTGIPGQVADVAVTDGRISEIGTGLSGSRVLDATGQVVTPGIEIAWSPRAVTGTSAHAVGAGLWSVDVDPNRMRLGVVVHGLEPHLSPVPRGTDATER